MIVHTRGAYKEKNGGPWQDRFWSMSKPDDRSWYDNFFTRAVSLSSRVQTKMKSGLYEYVIVHTILPPSQVSVWIELGGKLKWRPLNFLDTMTWCIQAPFSYDSNNQWEQQQQQQQQQLQQQQAHNVIIAFKKNKKQWQNSEEENNWWKQNSLKSLELKKKKRRKKKTTIEAIEKWKETMLVPYTYHSRLGRETMSTDRFLRRATCHHQMLFQRRFKLTLFSKQTSFLKMMSMNTLKFIHWLHIVLAKDLLINSDQEVVHQKWFSSTYLQTWSTEGREVAEDRTSWPAQQVTKDTYLRMHSFHQARRCYHRFQTHFLLSLSISDSVSHLLSCQKKKKKKKKKRKFIALHCSSTRAHHY